jgi:small-conductance mechanosensitive channel
MDIQQDINMMLFQRFRDASIPFANPTQTVHLARNNHPLRRQTDRDAGPLHEQAVAAARRH